MVVVFCVCVVFCLQNFDLSPLNRCIPCRVSVSGGNAHQLTAFASTISTASLDFCLSQLRKQNLTPSMPQDSLQSLRRIFLQILLHKALAHNCRPSVVFMLHKPKSTSGVFCRLGDNSNISFTKSSGRQADSGPTMVPILATAC